MPTLLVENATFLTQDPARPVERGRLVAQDGVIAAVGENARHASPDEVIDARGGIVLPGFVNAHAHLAMTLLRGAGEDLPLERWLREKIWPLEAKLDRAAVKAGSELAMLEMIASGTTTFNDMYFYADATAEAALASGLRAVVGATFLDFPTPEMRPEEMVDHARGFLKRWTGRSSLLSPALAPHATYTCGPATLDAVRALRDEARNPDGRRPLVHVHCAETRDEVQDVHEQRGARPVGVLARHGLLDGAVLAHCGWITKEEVRDIARAGAAVAHCPVSNMKLATGGWLPIPELAEAHVPVALGTDGAASNNTLDLLETLKFAALGQKQHRWDAGAVTARQALAMATRDGARALGLDRVGVLAPGWRADLVVLDTRRPGLRPVLDPEATVAYAARGGDVAATVVDGRVLYRDGEFTTMDAPRVLDDAERAAGRLRA